ncbi:MAG TPA: hypothetical protein VMW16_11895 [Sedimentisphaerales bacterium]|nr:hypothetical protein [Sedimentisphaerales bacterium]
MAQEDVRHNPECRSELHSKHLCYIISQGFHLSEPQQYKAMVEGARFKCGHCGRVAKSDKNLCEPVKL